MAFNLTSVTDNGIAKITLSGELDAASAGYFRDTIEQIATGAPRRLVLIADGLTYMASAGLRALVFAKQKMGASVDIYLIGVQEPVRETLEMTGFLYSVILLEAYDAAEIEKRLIEVRMEPLILPGTLDSLVLIRDYVKAAAAQAGLDRKRTYRLELAVDEIATNIINHGYDEAGRMGNVWVSATIGKNTLTIVLEDTAVPFDPRRSTRPEQIEQSLAERPIGGLGIFLAMENVDKFDYEFVGGRNRNIFRVNRSAAPPERDAENDGL